jgi:hypothetical protein
LLGEGLVALLALVGTGLADVGGVAEVEEALVGPGQGPDVSQPFVMLPSQLENVGRPRRITRSMRRRRTSTIAARGVNGASGIAASWPIAQHRRHVGKGANMAACAAVIHVGEVRLASIGPRAVAVKVRRGAANNDASSIRAVAANRLWLGHSAIDAARAAVAIVGRHVALAAVARAKITVLVARRAWEA